jgi:hypothetical protein
MRFFFLLVYYFDSTIGKYRVDFHPLKESKMCQYVHVIGSARTPRYLIVLVEDQLFISSACMSEMKHTCLYTRRIARRTQVLLHHFH